MRCCSYVLKSLKTLRLKWGKYIQIIGPFVLICNMLDRFIYHLEQAVLMSNGLQGRNKSNECSTKGGQCSRIYGWSYGMDS